MAVSTRWSRQSCRRWLKVSMDIHCTFLVPKQSLGTRKVAITEVMHMAPTNEIYSLSWPISRLGEALELLAQAGGLGSSPAPRSSLPEPPIRADDPHLGAWLEASARW